MVSISLIERAIDYLGILRGDVVFMTTFSRKAQYQALAKIYLDLWLESGFITPEDIGSTREELDRLLHS